MDSTSIENLLEQPLGKAIDKLLFSLYDNGGCGLIEEGHGYRKSILALLAQLLTALNHEFEQVEQKQIETAISRIADYCYGVSFF